MNAMDAIVSGNYGLDRSATRCPRRDRGNGPGRRRVPRQRHRQAAGRARPQGAKEHAEAALAGAAGCATQPGRGREARGARRAGRRRRARGQQSGRHQPDGRLDLERRCAQFADDIRGGEIRRSKLEEFIAGSQEAAKQLITNLNRAADLIQSFKQVAVDRSHAERRMFDLKEATEQIMVSLRPALKGSTIRLSVDMPDGHHHGQLSRALRPGADQPRAQHHHPRLSGPRGPARCGLAQGVSEQIRSRSSSPMTASACARGAPPRLRAVLHDAAQPRRHRARPAHRLQPRHPPPGRYLKLESEPGRGTAFNIRLPVVAPREEAADTAASPVESE